MSTTKLYPYEGEQLSLLEIARRRGLTPRQAHRLYYRVHRAGWSLERALSTGKVSRSDAGRAAKAKPECWITVAPRCF